ncbi:PLD nuclease N-terminal domain-containing protein [Kitasatospora sp. NPDC058965]|uniref:PLD nuclease N-terminal domain-containing protein n=1 Tax=Kitasatospora sp. NPDC058965 TaxID=3346682 RepID=UPI0036C4A445
MLEYLPFLLVLALWVWAFVDCLSTPEEQVRHLPKVVWVLVILFFGEVLLGPLAWLLAGRRRGPLPLARPAAGGPGRTLAPDDDPEFLASLRRRLADEQGDERGEGRG